MLAITYITRIMKYDCLQSANGLAANILKTIAEVTQQYVFHMLQWRQTSFLEYDPTWLWVGNVSCDVIALYCCSGALGMRGQLRNKTINYTGVIKGQTIYIAPVKTHGTFTKIGVYM